MATTRAGTVPGFKSFWERSKREAASQNLTFVQVEIEHPNESKKNNKGLRVRRRESSETISNGAKSESPPPENRRKQVYQAQRRHRQRKTDYAKSLEDEIAQLERLHAVIVSESQCLSDENDAIKRLLHSQGLGSQVEEAESWSSAISADEASSADVRTTKSSDTNETGHPQNSDNQRGSRWKELLNPSNPQIDSTSRDRIEQSQMLLLRDVKPFQSDEAEEKQAWERLADLVIDGG